MCILHTFSGMGDNARLHVGMYASVDDFGIKNLKSYKSVYRLFSLLSFLVFSYGSCSQNFTVMVMCK